jgi:hypothetical protein
MSLRARVGRHTHDRGRQCQNFPADQQAVIDLLNRIPVIQGGAGGALKGPVVPGMCSDALYRAISQFEDKYFPGQRSGFVDPGGAMLKRMEALAGRAQPKADAESPLDILSRNVQNADKVVAVHWTAGDRVRLDELVAMAIKHIGGLKQVKDKSGIPLDKLPSWAELFGRAYILKPWEELINVKHGRFSDALIKPHLEAIDQQGHTYKVEDTMKYGHPLKFDDEIVTWKLPALILFQDGLCSFVPSQAQVVAAAQHEFAMRKLVTKSNY